MKTLHIKILSILSLAALTLNTSCKKYLDVNTDPNNPTSVSAANRLVGAITTTSGASMWRGSREIAGLVQYGATQLNTGTNRNADNGAIQLLIFSGKMLMYIRCQIVLT
ncbi:hypothetical protein [Pedobacter sp. NJ-S-72]